MKKKKRDFSPIHPGEILVSEFLEPMGMPQPCLMRNATKAMCHIVMSWSNNLESTHHEIEEILSELETIRY